MPRREKTPASLFIAVFLILATVLLSSITISTNIVNTPVSKETPIISSLKENPIIQALGQFGQSVSSALEPVFNSVVSTPTAEVGIGATIGYTSTSGQSVVFNEWKQSGVVLSGVALTGLQGVVVAPDKPGARTLKLYDRDTGAEGEIWFEPYVSVRVFNGTVLSHNFTVTKKVVSQCENEPPETLHVSMERNRGFGAPSQNMKFGKSSVKGSDIFRTLNKAVERGKNTCQIYLMVDYEGIVTFENPETGEPEQVRRRLENVVLGSFVARKSSPAGDFTFEVAANATVRPFEMVVGGSSGAGGMTVTTRTATVTERITYTTTVAVGGGGTTVVTKTQTVVSTTVQTVATYVTVTQTQQVTQTVTVTVTAGGGESTRCNPYTQYCPIPVSGVVIKHPHDAFIFFPGRYWYG
ncbi:MAG: hypothetical protein QXU30_07020 [Sulfolobales archaeon]